MTAPDPMEVTIAAKAGTNTVRLVKRGGGVLYWAAQATYYDTQAAQERTGSHKLALQRHYFSLAPVTVKGRAGTVAAGPAQRASAAWHEPGGSGARVRGNCWR